MLRKLSSSLFRPLKSQMPAHSLTMKLKQQQSELAKFNESFLSGTNAIQVEELFDKWNHDPESVPASWDAYFKAMLRGASSEEVFVMPPGLNQQKVEFKVGTQQISPVTSTVSESQRLILLIDAYRRRGHELADLDPLRTRGALAIK